MGAIIKRELYSYFCSPIAYVVMAIFMFFSGLFFTVVCLANDTSNLTYVFTNMFLITILLTPIMCMKLLSDEKRLKTDQALLTSPVSIFGIVMGILASVLYKKTLFRGEAVPFVMELPNYRLPGAKNVARLLWEKAKDFLQRAFTVIFVSTIIVWFLRNFDLHLNMTANSQDSILAMIAGFIAPVFAPAGLGSWEIVTALISGFLAKESVVSTLEVLYSGGITSAMSTLTAVSLLVFSLLYTPCIAAVAAVKRELGLKWALVMVVWQCAVAWVMSALVFLAGSFMGL